MEQVILVDENDKDIGTMEKMAAHEQGCLHRAFSVLIFNSNNEILVHKRASTKYHSASLWTNACCSHPRLGESTLEAAIRRTKEEIGITCSPQFLFKFIYKVELANSLIEHEFDQVFIAKNDDKPTINPEEIESWKYMSMDELQLDVKHKPEKYTHWFKLILQNKQFVDYTNTNMNS